MKLKIFVGGLLVGSSLGRPLEQLNEEELDILSRSPESLATSRHARSDQRQKRQLFSSRVSPGVSLLAGLLGPNAPLRQELGAATNPTPWGTYSGIQAAGTLDMGGSDIAQSQYQSTSAAPLDEQPVVAWGSTSSPSTSEAQPVAWGSSSSGPGPNNLGSASTSNSEPQPVVSWDSARPAAAPLDGPAREEPQSASLSLAPAAIVSSSPRPMSYSAFSPRPYSSSAPPPPSPSVEPATASASPSSSSSAAPKSTVTTFSTTSQSAAKTSRESATSSKESPDTANTVTSSTSSTSSASSTSSTSISSAAKGPKGFPKASKSGGSFPKLPLSRSIGGSTAGTSRSGLSTSSTSSSRAFTGLSTQSPRPSPKTSSRATASTPAGTPAGTHAAGPTHAALPTSGAAAAWDRHAKTHTFQIILSGTPDIKPNAVSVTPNVDVYDVDLFMTDKTTISTLKRLNKTVICYFSGGTYEPGRPDSRKFVAADMGYRLLEWPSEKWLKLDSTSVRRIMADRIQLAREKGCDAIDPDNVDGFQAAGFGGLNLRKHDSVSFVRFLSETAEKYGMATGLKNAMDLIREIRPYVHFAVNEQCADKRECKQYASFQKPVFHIEYPRLDREMAKGLSPALRQRYCVDNDNTINKFFHTVIKPKELNGVVQYCDGKLWKTPTKDAKGGRSRNGYFDSHDPAIEGEAASPKEWQYDPAMIALQEELAKQDGYPYSPGQGSESVVSDADLLKSYDRVETSRHDDAFI